MSNPAMHIRTHLLSRYESQWKWIFPIYLFLAMANVRTKALITYGYFNGALLRQHDQLIHAMCRERPQYRVLAFLIPEFLHRFVGMMIVDAYVLQRLIWTTLTFIALHLYLRKWFSTAVSMAGTLFFAAIMQWVYFDHLHESEPCNVFMFVVGLWAIRENAWWPLLIILIIGSFNKLTVIFLPLGYFFCLYNVLDRKRLVLRTAVLFATVVFISGGIRWFYRNTPNDNPGFTFEQFIENASGVAAALKLLPFRFFVAPELGLLFMYGAFWIIAFMAYAEKPLFLRRIAMLVPFFCIFHLFLTRLCEYRPYLALAPILIPMGLWYLFGGVEERPHNAVAGLHYSRARVRESSYE